MTDVVQSRFDMLLVEGFTSSTAGARPRMSDARSPPWPRVNFPSQLAPQFRAMAQCTSTNTEPESGTRDARQKRSTQSKEARRRDAIKAISEETEMASATYHEPHAMSQSKKAAASGWIGSALEYYDFFIYATAASLVFPQIFFPSANPTTAIVASLPTYGRRYRAQPLGRLVLWHWVV